MGQKISRLILFTLDLFISLILIIVIFILLSGGTFFLFQGNTYSASRCGESNCLCLSFDDYSFVV